MTADPGFIAYFALFGMVITSLAVWAVKRPEDTSLVLILAAIMFLPVGANFKIPKVPALDKDTLPYLCLFIPIFFRRMKWARKNRLGRGLDFLLVVSMVCAVFTVNDNRDPLALARWDPSRVLPGLNLNDGLALAGDDLLRVGIPFMLGRLLMRSSREGTKLLTAFAVGGLVYSLFILFEVRMSPQLHNWIYGYAPRKNDFDQSIRFGGYRPVVFMPHGLAVSLFMCNTVLAAFVLVRARAKFYGISWKPFAFYLLFILVATKSAGAVAYAFVLAPVVAFLKPRNQLRVSMVLALVVLLYPILRGSDIFPTKGTVNAMSSVFGPDRAASMAFRFMNEDRLLAKARQRLAFGWGSYGRNSIYEPEYGKEDATFDGHWIIVLSMRGAIAAACVFLMLLLPIFIALRRLRKIPGKKEQMMIAGLGVIVAISAFDLVPNGLFLNYPFFLSGALLGLARVLSSPEAQQAQHAPEALHARLDPRYDSRFIPAR